MAPESAEQAHDSEDARLLDLALVTAREAGELVVALRERGVAVAATKSSPVDVVTAADRACEELIRERLLGARPGDGFVGEEGADVAVHVRRDAGSWTRSTGRSTTSTGSRTTPSRSPRCAETGLWPASYATPPRRWSTPRCWAGAPPATTAPLRVRSTPPLAQALIGTGFGYETRARARQARAAARMLPQVRDIRRQGSCALDLCAVAAGTLDAYVEEGPHIWDHAAGALVAAEAGARVEVWTTAAAMELVVARS